MATYTVPTVGQLQGWVANLNRLASRRKLFIEPALSELPRRMLVDQVTVCEDLADCIEVNFWGLDYPICVSIFAVQLDSFTDSDLGWLNVYPAWLAPKDEECAYHSHYALGQTRGGTFFGSQL